MFTISIEFDGEIGKTWDSVSDLDGTIEAAAQEVRGAPLVCAHVRRNGEFVAEVRTDFNGNVRVDKLMEDGTWSCYDLAE